LKSNTASVIGYRLLPRFYNNIYNTNKQPPKQFTSTGCNLFLKKSLPMNFTDHYIAADWGTSNLRLSLVASDTGAILKSTTGPGVSEVTREEIPSVVATLTEEWQSFDCDKLLMSGMVGSTIGWVDAGYIDCPTETIKLSDHLCETIVGNYHSWIVPGLCCKNPMGAPDVMRGEELQLLGALRMKPELRNGEYLFCMPGTHNKWIHTSSAVVNNFFTCISGELYALLTQHSVVAHAIAKQEFDLEAFQLGVERGASNRNVDSLNLLFETRSRQLSKSINAEHCHAFLSGLIIGKDIDNATKLYFKRFNPQSLVFCGEEHLTSLYNIAANQLGWDPHIIDGHVLSTTGIHQIYLNLIYGGENALLF
jgi:2-dehydro-3-deoxygalactonokinase